MSLNERLDIWAVIPTKQESESLFFVKSSAKVLLFFYFYK